MVSHLLHRFHGLHQKLPASSIKSSVFLTQLHSTFSLRARCYTPDEPPTSSSSQSQSQSNSQSVVRTICSLVCQSYYQQTHVRFIPPKLHLPLDSESLTHDQAITVVASLVDEAGSMVALSFLYWAIGFPKFRHFMRLYIVSATALIGNKNLERANEVMQCMVMNFSEAGKLKEAVNMVVEMQNQGLVLSTQTLNCVLDVAVEMGLAQIAENVFDEMCERGVSPDCGSFKLMVVSCCNMGRVLEAERWLNAMVERGFIVDNATCLQDANDEEEHYCTSGSISKLQFRKDISKAIWNDEMGMAEIVEKKGRMWITTGIVRNSKTYCSIEETLFLAEIGALRLLDDNDVPISLKGIYDKVAQGKCGCCWESFEVYRHLKSLGYIVGRHGIPWTLKGAKTCLDFHQDTPESKSMTDEESEEKISIIEPFNNMHITVAKLVFDVYLPNSKFRKSFPGDPSFVLCLTSGHPPLKAEIEDLERQCSGIPFKFCHVAHGRVSFFSFSRVELPVLP